MIFFCSSFCSLWYHGASPVTISYSNTPHDQMSTAYGVESYRIIARGGILASAPPVPLPFIVSYRKRNSAQPNLGRDPGSINIAHACPHGNILMISGAMYSVVPISTGRPDADDCVDEAVTPIAASPKSQSLM